jgi:hypothetical protein
VNKNVFFLFLMLWAVPAAAQELYPYSEPASNMPARSISLKNASMFEKGKHASHVLHRHMPEVMLGLNKNWMLHGGLFFSNMHKEKMIWEGARVYGKYRFYSADDVHKHFRMAAFAAASYSRNHMDHNEINLMGDQSGVQAGLIATQLWNKLAVSGTASWNEVIDDLRSEKTNKDIYAFRAVNYSVSAGYLVLPFQYKNYDQTNMNLYVELLGSRNMDLPDEKYYVDLAPSIQFIFKSNSKLNLGYRFQLAGDIYRLADRSYMISYEHIFLNALKKKKKD